ncbi:hypothetical protein LINPERHAP2_LOCUS23907 [Linum perenne]
MVADHYVVSEEWRPYFRPEDSSLSSLRVWIRLPGIPLEYFDYGILKRIGDRIGKTVRIDHTTLEGSRGNFARICVEVDISKPLLSKYRLRRRVRRIEYEGLHTICFSCGCYGHEEASCPEKNVKVMDEPMATTFTNPIFTGDGLGETHPEVEEDFGPWMKVKRQPRRPSSNRYQGAAPGGQAEPATSSGKGKTATGFNVLQDLGDKEDLEGQDKESVSPPKRSAASSDNKENLPSAEVNIPQQVVSDVNPKGPKPAVPKPTDFVEVGSPGVLPLGLGVKRGSQSKEGGGKLGPHSNSSYSRPKDQQKGQASRSLGGGSNRSGPEKGRLKGSSAHSESVLFVPDGVKSSSRADQAVVNDTEPNVQRLIPDDVLMSEANANGKASSI